MARGTPTPMGRRAEVTAAAEAIASSPGPCRLARRAQALLDPGSVRHTSTDFSARRRHPCLPLPGRREYRPRTRRLGAGRLTPGADQDLRRLPSRADQLGHRPVVIETPHIPQFGGQPTCHRRHALRPAWEAQQQLGRRQRPRRRLRRQGWRQQPPGLLRADPVPCRQPPQDLLPRRLGQLPQAGLLRPRQHDRQRPVIRGGRRCGRRRQRDRCPRRHRYPLERGYRNSRSRRRVLWRGRWRWRGRRPR